MWYIERHHAALHLASQSPLHLRWTRIFRLKQMLRPLPHRPLMLLMLLMMLIRVVLLVCRTCWYFSTVLMSIPHLLSCSATLYVSIDTYVLPGKKLCCVCDAFFPLFSIPAMLYHAILTITLVFVFFVFFFKLHRIHFFLRVYSWVFYFATPTKALSRTLKPEAQKWNAPLAKKWTKLAADKKLLASCLAWLSRNLVESAGR